MLGMARHLKGYINWAETGIPKTSFLNHYTMYNVKREWLRRRDWERNEERERGGEIGRAREKER